MTSMVNARIKRDLQDRLRELVKELKGRGHRREVLSAMAHILQEEFSMAHDPDFPLAPAMDDIMRAISHEIEGDPSMRTYIRQKFETGSRTFLNWISQAA